MIREEKLYDHTSTTSNSTQIELLKKLFPNCFDKKGAFMPQKMAEVVGKNEISLSRESYSLNWLGKAYARVLAHESPLTFLKEDEAHNQKEVHKKSGNILIKGDNLEVLKHLRNAYAEQIKMIYIDPPYNTGGDGFVYNDDRKFTPEQLMRLAGIELDESKRILEFTRSKANSHSAWLTFMYPRLYIARELLQDDGVIFISIDDNEQAQLKLLCDEVFGEENFVANIVWQKKYAATNDAKGFSNLHDYILIYQKSANFERYLLPRTEALNKPYKNDDNDGKGLWRSDNLLVKSFSLSGVYPIINPNTGVEYFPPDGSSWRASQETMHIWLAENRIYWGKDGNGAPQLKRYLNEVQDGKVPTTWWTFEDAGHNDAANKEVAALFGTKTPFDTPKPTTLITNMLKITTKNSDLVLDFFAGSGTTAHAVMDLNAKDGGQRKYICVQLPEHTNTKSEAHKAGYNTIFDITKARIEKAAEKIRTETSLLTQELDLGFKIFETEPLFEGYGEEVETLAQDTTLFDGSTLEDASLQTLLTTWKLYDGLSLTTPMQHVMLAKYTAYQAGKNLYIMHQGFDINAIKALICNLDDEVNFNASKIVLFGYNVLSTTQRELHEALQNYTNKKSIELDVVVRY